MDIFWEWRQSQRIAQAETEASSAKSKAQRAEFQADSVRDQLDRLMLANAAMWSLLREHHGLTDKDLLDRMEELDAADGKMNGKLTPAPRTCPTCARRSPSWSLRCIYCDQKLGTASPF